MRERLCHIVYELESQLDLANNGKARSQLHNSAADMELLLLIVSTFPGVLLATPILDGLAERDYQHLFQAKQNALLRPQDLFNLTQDLGSPKDMLSLPIE